jgi:hypothetical protein
MRFEKRYIVISMLRKEVRGVVNGTQFVDIVSVVDWSGFCA